jgi:hypothetical protein
MAISGMCGLSFFLIANFTSIFEGLNVVAGCLQLGINVFGFTAGVRAWPRSRAFKRFSAFLWIVGPLTTATITLYRVLIPFIS